MQFFLKHLLLRGGGTFWEQSQRLGYSFGSIQSEYIHTQSHIERYIKKNSQRKSVNILCQNKINFTITDYFCLG